MIRKKMSNSSAQTAEILSMERACRKCGSKKPLSEFYDCGHGIDGKHSYCKMCERQRRRNRYRNVEAARGVRDLDRRLRLLELKDECPEGMKVCARCEETKPLDEFYRSPDLKSGRNSYCKVCDAEIIQTYRARSPKDRLGLSLNSARHTARRKDLPFDLTIDDVVALWEQQSGRCAYSGQQMTFDGQRQPESVSIDRIDSSGGYTRDNVVLCCVFVNIAKSNYPLDELLMWCKLILEYNVR